MKIKVLGSGREVGKSAFVVDDGNKKIVMDYGVKIHPEPPKYPPRVKADIGIITHAHLDHSGGAPILSAGKIPTYMTDVTLELSELLLRDSINVSKKNGYDTPFSKKDVKKFVKRTKLANYNEGFRIGNSQIELFGSGHIPGGSSVLIDNDRTIFYTADIQTIDSHLLPKCELPKDIDVLVMESTYSYKDHPNRSEEEEKLLRFVEETLSNNENALIPSFAVGRSQEILMILEKYKKYIALDGMSKKASHIIADYPRYLRDPKKFKKILNRIHLVDRKEDKRGVLEDYPIIVSSAGMMGGGPIISYLKEVRKRENSSVLFTGFLVEDTPGRKLLNTGVFQNDNERFKVKCNIHQLNLSAHTDREGMDKIIDVTNPELILTVHGDKCGWFAEDIKKKMGINAIAPKNNQTVII